MAFRGNFTTGSGGGGGDVTAQPVVDDFGVLAADDDAIVTSFATSTSIVTKSGGGLNGIVGAAALAVPRGATIKTTSSASAYNTTDPITVVGIGWDDAPQTTTITLTQGNGNETLESLKTFKSFTSFAFPAMLTGSGAIRVGIGTRVGLRYPAVEAASGVSYIDARVTGQTDVSLPSFGPVSSPPNGCVDFGVSMDGGTVLGATYSTAVA